MDKQKKKTNSYKIIIALLFVLIFFLNFSYAEDACNSTLNTTSNLMTLLSWIASRIWIVLSRVAGTLMSNSIIYGSFMNLDVFLWKMWQMSRTFANFALGFMFLISIFRYILFSSKQWNTPIKTIKEILLASVFVQLSWFLVMIVIDLSTIAISAVASFPAQIIDSSESVQKPLIDELGKSELVSKALGEPHRCVVFNALWGSYADDKDENWVEEVDCEITPDLMTGLVDNVIPSPKNLSWPFMYLWLSVFRTKVIMNEVSQTNTDCVEKFTRVFINILFDAFLTILFSLALLILVILLLFRLMYIWLFIAISPIIVLLHFTSLKKYASGDILSSLKIWSVLRLIFQPVFFALFVSLMLLVIITFQAFMKDGTPEAPWFSMDESKMPDGTYTTQIGIWWNVTTLVQQWTRSVSQIFLSLLALAMMWYLVKMAVSNKTWIKGFDKQVENLSGMYSSLTDLPIVPTPRWWISLSYLNPMKPEKMRYQYKTKSKLWKKIAEFENFDGRQAEELDSIARKLWLDDDISRSLSSTQQDSLDLAVQKPNVDALRDAISDIKENQWINWSQIRPYIIEWINKNKNTTNFKMELSKLFGDILRVNLPIPDELDEKNLPSIAKDQGWMHFYKNILKWKENVRNYSDLEKKWRIRKGK